MGNGYSNPFHLLSLIKVVFDLLVLQATRSINNKIPARVIFQEFGVSCA